MLTVDLSHPALRALQVNSHQLGEILKAHFGTYYDKPSDGSQLNSKVLSSLEEAEEPTSIQQAWHMLHLATELHKIYIQLGPVHTADAKMLLSRTKLLYIKV